jgi:hypothetical protein
MKLSAGDIYGSLYIFEQTARLRHNRKHKTTIDCLTPRIRLIAENAKSASPCQEVPLILFRPKVHYSVVPIMNQMNRIQSTPLTSPSSNVHFNINFPHTPTCSARSLSSSFPSKTQYALLSHACHMRASSHHRINIC